MLEYIFSNSHHTGSIYKDNYTPRLLYVHEYNKLDPNLTIPSTTLHFLQIILLEEGRCYLNLNNKEYKVMSGDIIIIKPKASYYFKTIDSPKFKALSLRIDNLHLIHLPPNEIQYDNAHPIIHSYKNLPSLPKYFHLCKDLAIQNQKINALEYNPQTTLLQSLLTVIHQVSIENNPLPKPKEIIEETIKTYLDEHFLEDLSLQEISKALHISPSYLAHKFKDYTGVSPMQYIIRKRISEAQKLLLNTDLNITQISFHCGFNNSNYFHQVFAHAVGVSPGKYRKLWKK